MHRYCLQFYHQEEKCVEFKCRLGGKDISGFILDSYYPSQIAGTGKEGPVLQDPLSHMLPFLCSSLSSYLMLGCPTGILSASSLLNYCVLPTVISLNILVYYCHGNTFPALKASHLVLHVIVAFLGKEYFSNQLLVITAHSKNLLLSCIQVKP